MRIPNETLVIVADGEKFVALTNHGDEERIDLRVVTYEAIDNPPSHIQGTDRPGRFPDPGHGKSAVAETDWHRLEKERFAHDLADRLKTWALAGRFERLVLIADPATLGRLRGDLHGEVRRRLIGEFDKDLTNHAIDKIEALLLAA